jgi:hypothetical protein
MTAMKTSYLICRLLLAAVVALGLGPSSSAAWAAGPSRAELVVERTHLMIENAALRARLSLARDQSPYIVVDLPRKTMQLELQGVTLTSVPVQEVLLNRHAKRTFASEDEVNLLETPFVLQEDRWFEVGKTLALKDSSAVRSRPDTTGALMQQIRLSPVTALLSYDRELTLVLDGKPPRTRWERLREKVRNWFRSWSAGTLEGLLRQQSSEEVMVTLVMAPADVRSLAPSMLTGTRLILVP